MVIDGLRMSCYGGGAGGGAGGAGDAFGSSTVLEAFLGDLDAG